MKFIKFIFLLDIMFWMTIGLHSGTEYLYERYGKSNFPFHESPNNRLRLHYFHLVQSLRQKYLLKYYWNYLFLLSHLQQLNLHQ